MTSYCLYILGSENTVENVARGKCAEKHRYDREHANNLHGKHVNLLS